MSIVTTIDLGSNSFRVLRYDCKSHKILDEYNEVVCMADGLNDTGLISKEAQQRVVLAIKNSIEKLNYNPKEAVCVTTAAMRKASNNKEVLKYFLEQTGVRFRIINGIEEASLTLLAVQYALKREKIESTKFILLDIGGASTEIIVNIEDKFFSKSFDFGIVTLTQKYYLTNTLHIQLERYKDEIRVFLDSLKINPKEFTFVATAGTPTTVAAIKQGQDFFNYDKQKVNGSTVNFDDLDYCLNIFKNESIDSITKLVGKGRVEFIEVGVLIYRSIFEVLEKSSSIVFDDGLREGVAINYCLTNCN